MCNKPRPNFFIVGAPKCGTTSLAAWLSQHPQIYMVPGKEPHFFNKDGGYWIESLEEYERLFNGATEQNLAIGEASTGYLYSKVAIREILNYNPRAKLVVSIRNPIEMAPALHAEMVWLGQETITDFARAWEAQEMRRKGEKIPFTMRQFPEGLLYGERCRLGKQIEHLFEYAPREQVLVLVLDDIAEDPEREYRKVLRFLGVNEDFRPDFKVYNKRKAVRWPWVSFALQTLNRGRRGMGFKKPLRLFDKVMKWNTTKGKTQLSPEMRAMLLAYFEEDIRLLEGLVGRDFSHWRR